MPRKRAAPEAEEPLPKEAGLKRARKAVAKAKEPVATAKEAVSVAATRRDLPRRGRVNKADPELEGEPEPPVKASKKTAKPGRRAARVESNDNPEDAPASKKGKPKSKAAAAPAVNGAAAANSPSAPSEEEPRPWFWLMKAEPESRIEKGVDVKFSIDDLASRTEPEKWDGVRNYVARNNMRAMKKGEKAFFYHSNCKIPGIAGVMEIVGEAEDDESAFDSNHPYFDPKSQRDNPRWSIVRVQFVRKFDRLISLPELRTYQAGELKDMSLLRQGRLSVSRVGQKEWEFILGLEKLESQA